MVTKEKALNLMGHGFDIHDYSLYTKQIWQATDH